MERRGDSDICSLILVNEIGFLLERELTVLLGPFVEKGLRDHGFPLHAGDFEKGLLGHIGRA